jgi:hypothetical protein
MATISPGVNDQAGDRVGELRGATGDLWGHDHRLDPLAPARNKIFSNTDLRDLLYNIITDIYDGRRSQGCRVGRQEGEKIRTGVSRELC